VMESISCTQREMLEAHQLFLKTQSDFNQIVAQVATEQHVMAQNGGAKTAQLFTELAKHLQTLQEQQMYAARLHEKYLNEQTEINKRLVTLLEQTTLPPVPAVESPATIETLETPPVVTPPVIDEITYELPAAWYTDHTA